MGFLSPWMLLGIAALAAPVILHLVERAETRGRAFPSLMFLRPVKLKLRRRKTLRDRRLLLVRCLTLLLLALAFAGPFLPLRGDLAPGAEITTDRVFLLDRSFSTNGGEAWRTARDHVADGLSAMTSGERAAIVAFDTRAEVLADLGDDRAALEQALDRIEPGFGATDFAAAIGAAERVLQSSDAPNREIVLVSDLQASGFYAERSPRLASGISLALRAVEPAPRPAVRVGRVEMLPPARGTASDRRTLRATIRNDGETIARQVPVEIVVNGFQVDRRTLDIPPGGESTLDTPVILPAEDTARIRVSAGAAGGPGGHDYYLAVESEPVAEVLVASGADRGSNSRIFLDQAFALSRYPSVRAEFLDGAMLSRDALAGRAIVVLDGVDPLGDGLGQALDDYVRSGGALLVIPTDTPREWPERSGFLPGSLRPGVVESGTPVTGIELSGSHPLGESLGQALRRRMIDADMSRHRVLAPGPDDRVLARFGNGRAALVEREGIPGRVLALATSLDPAWSNLASDPAFAPLVIETVRYLIDQHARAPQVHAGEGVDLAGHGSTAAAAIVETPQGRTLTLRAGENTYLPETPGFHEVHQVGNGATTTLAVNVNPVEYDANVIDATEFTARLATTPATATDRGAPSAPAAGDDETVRPLWWIILAAAAALFALETFLANRRAGGRTIDARAMR